MLRPVPSNRRFAYGTALCLASAAAFGIAVLFAREGRAAGVPLVTMLAIRFAVAALAFAAWMVVRRVPAPPARAVLACAALGAVGYAAQAMLYFGALVRVDAALAALVLYLYPGFVVAAAVALRRERAEWRLIVALACSLAGIVLLLGGDVGPQSHLVIPGLAMALAAALAYTASIIVADGLLERIDVVAASTIICAAAAVSLGLVGMLTGGLRLPSVAGLAWSTALGVVSTFVAIGCFFLGIRIVGSAKAAVLSSAEPIVTAGVGMVVYGEPFTGWRLLAALAIIASVVILQQRARRPTRAGQHVTAAAGDVPGGQAVAVDTTASPVPVCSPAPGERGI
jgi:drug/metabolite transporter (DMT)-like permease